jgi:AraC-like DNA-binding protein
MRAAYREFRPPPALAACVECLWSVDAAVAVPNYGVAPDGCLDIVYSASGGLRAVGAMTRERRFELPAGERHCGVRFRPGMANAFLKTPADELTDCEAPLEDLWGAAAQRLTERLEEARSPEDAAAAFAGVLRAPAPANGVQRAIAAMAAAHGAVDVDEVARQANLSARQFRRRCLEASGLTPKYLCRVLRFRNAAGMAARAPGLKWALVAADAGYFDQAHLIRDFREFTGRPPMAVFSNTGGRGGA